jgi:hypothetical protein
MQRERERERDGVNLEENLNPVPVTDQPVEFEK